MEADRIQLRRDRPCRHACGMDFRMAVVAVVLFRERRRWRDHRDGLEASWRGSIAWRLWTARRTDVVACDDAPSLAATLPHRWNRRTLRSRAANRIIGNPRAAD